MSVMSDQFKQFNRTNVSAARGLKFSSGSVSVDGVNPSAAIVTGLSSVTGAVATAQGATPVATAVTISGGSITIEAAGAATVTVHWFAWGY